ncbi:MAG: hypothetical protein L6V84_08285 [Oscillospiraceae bacterium]|nr:MAG: hypothetical protein L6V84_08285 [Oscillospiraceae bacterium]
MIAYRDARIDFGPINTFVQYPELNSILEKVKASGAPGLNTIIASQGLFRFSENFFCDHPEAKGIIGEGTGNKNCF